MLAVWAQHSRRAACILCQALQAVRALCSIFQGFTHWSKATCTFCQALAASRALRMAAAAVGAACLLGLAAALGGSAPLTARAPLALTAGAVLAAACFVWFGRVAQSYIYVGWDHPSNH